ncbi:MAG TPA: hypothetical protein DG753_00135 [Clostridium sp.]|nr:hypothetical protein [Clostridium sp.]
MGNFEGNFDVTDLGKVDYIEDRNLESERPVDVDGPPEDSIFDSILEDYFYQDSDRPTNDGPGPISIDKVEKLDKIERPEIIKTSSLLPRNGGIWTGEPGNSHWKPDPSIEPGDRNGTNPESKTWQEIMDEYGFESIPFKDGEPDFSEVSKGEVEIDDFSDDRSSNFDQADEKLAEQKGCTPEEVAEWREKNKYTWHECDDCKTMQKVPTEVHGNISHSGGISKYKAENNV